MVKVAMVVDGVADIEVAGEERSEVEEELVSVDSQVCRAKLLMLEDHRCIRRRSIKCSIPCRRISRRSRCRSAMASIPRQAAGLHQAHIENDHGSDRTISKSKSYEKKRGTKEYSEGKRESAG